MMGSTPPGPDINNTTVSVNTAAQLRALLDEVSNGHVDPDEAHRRIVAALRDQPFADLGFAKVDHHRTIRQGFPEVILGLGKTPAQIAAIADELSGHGSTVLVTRATEEAFIAVQAVLPTAVYHAEAHIIALRQQDIVPGKGRIVVVAAGTSDLPVAEEAACTAQLMGNDVERLYDVGVAGIHRLLRERARLDLARVIIVIAGMEGALPSVVSG